MNPRPFAWTAGALLLLLGIAGFIPPLAPAEADPLRIAAGVGGAQLLGLFPVAPVLSGLHAALGAWGLWAGSRLGRSLWFARRAALVFAVLLVMGMIPGADTLFGMAPLYGNNLLLHGLLAILCFLFGWMYRRPTAGPESEEADEV
jgi:hypothetical protein